MPKWDLGSVLKTPNCRRYSEVCLFKITFKNALGFLPIRNGITPLAAPKFFYQNIIPTIEVPWFYF